MADQVVSALLVAAILGAIKLLTVAYGGAWQFAKSIPGTLMFCAWVSASFSLGRASVDLEWPNYAALSGWAAVALAVLASVAWIVIRVLAFNRIADGKKDKG